MMSSTVRPNFTASVASHDHVGGAGTDHMDADDLVSFVVFDDLNEAIGVL